MPRLVISCMIEWIAANNLALGRDKKRVKFKTKD